MGIEEPFRLNILVVMYNNRLIVNLCICSLCATLTPTPSYPRTLLHPHSPVGPYGTASAEFTTFPVKREAFQLVVRFSSDQLADTLKDEDAEIV